MKIFMKKRRTTELAKRLTAALLWAAVSVLAACGNADPGAGGGTGSPGVGKNTPAAVNTTNLSGGITANALSADRESNPSATASATDFGLQMLCRNIQAGEDVLLSPASVLFALGMTANGAREDTRAQLETAFGMSVEELNRYLYAYRQSLPCEQNCKVTAANSIWFREDPSLSVVPEFLQINADYYAADIYETPFDDSAKKAVNDWVNRNTDGMIDRILDQISPDSLMYLINAMAFDAKWMEPYYQKDIREGNFTREDGTVRPADFMYSEESKYLEDEHAVGFLKYYEGGKYAFAALLPEPGISLDDYAASLTGERLNRILTSPVNTKVYASIPKFETEYSAELGQTLEAMGISDAFDPGKADFTGLASYADHNIFISRVLHKTYIRVDENGTKAAAVTAAIVDECESIEEPSHKTVYLDRPFLYFLVDCEEGLPIFMGALTL